MKMKITDHDSGLFTVIETKGMTQEQIKERIKEVRAELKQKAKNDAGKQND